MSYFAYSWVQFHVRAGTTPEQVRAAGALLSDYFDASDVEVEGPLLENGVNFRVGDLEVFVGVNSKGHANFADEIFVPVMRAFGELADAPFSANLMREGGPPPPGDLVVSDSFGPPGSRAELLPDTVCADVDVGCEPGPCG